MKMQELKEKAQQFIDREPGEGFAFEEFFTRSGGYPDGMKLVADAIVHKGSWFSHGTRVNGEAWGSRVVVECRDTGLKDKEGETVWETPSGVAFVWKYRGGDAGYFDWGRFLAPEMPF